MSVDRHLGQDTSYDFDGRDPSLLVGEDRSIARDTYGYKEDLWDTGFDVWHCYETMFYVGDELLTGITKLVFPVNNPKIVESKSLKLYMFSLTEARFESISQYEEVVEKDLSKIVEGVAAVHFHKQVIGKQTQADYGTVTEHVFFTPLLRSNCKVTGQPDYGDLYINSSEPIDSVSLHKKLDQLREENHFHEECVEMLFQDLYNGQEQLEVYAKYTRRGGIDIHPYRAIGVSRRRFTKVSKLTNKTFRG